MYTFDLAERLKDDQVKVNAVHPASLNILNKCIRYLQINRQIGFMINDDTVFEELHILDE